MESPHKNQWLAEPGPTSVSLSLVSPTAPPVSTPVQPPQPRLPSQSSSTTTKKRLRVDENQDEEIASETSCDDQREDSQHRHLPLLRETHLPLQLTHLPPLKETHLPLQETTAGDNILLSASGTLITPTVQAQRGSDSEVDAVTSPPTTSSSYSCSTAVQSKASPSPLHYAASTPAPPSALKPPRGPPAKRYVQIVGQSGDFQLCKIAVAAKEEPGSPDPKLKKKTAAFRHRNGNCQMGMELRRCEWMTKEMRLAFPGGAPCIAVVSVGRGLAKQAGFRPKDILCWPVKKTEARDTVPGAATGHVRPGGTTTTTTTKTVWELMNEAQLKDSLEWLQVNGKIAFYVARKLSAADIEILRANQVKRAAAATAPQSSFAPPAHSATMSAAAALQAAGHGGPLQAIPSGGTVCARPKPPLPPPAHSVSKEQIRLDKDVVLGRPGNVRPACASTLTPIATTTPTTATSRFQMPLPRFTTVYQETLTAWWERYELASHTEKIAVCKLAIADMIAQGCRFLSRVDDGSRHGYYVVVPSTSESIRKKVLRALRQEVLVRLEPLTREKRTVVLDVRDDDCRVTGSVQSGGGGGAPKGGAKKAAANPNPFRMSPGDVASAVASTIRAVGPPPRVVAAAAAGHIGHSGAANAVAAVVAPAIAPTAAAAVTIDER